MRQGREVNHSPSVAEITNEGSNTSSPLHAVMEWENFPWTFAVVS